MSKRKERLTVTVDRALVEAGDEAVAEGRAESLSAWVNRALAERVARERQLSAMAGAIAEYEAKFGVLTDEELAGQARADRKAAVVVRGPAGRRTRARRGRGAA